MKASGGANAQAGTRISWHHPWQADIAAARNTSRKCPRPASPSILRGGPPKGHMVHASMVRARAGAHGKAGISAVGFFCNVLCGWGAVHPSSVVGLITPLPDDFSQALGHACIEVVEHALRHTLDGIHHGFLELREG